MMMSCLCGTAALLLCIGLYCLCTKRNLVKIVIGLQIMESGILMFLVSLGYRPGAVEPILVQEATALAVDPVPQALALTAVVISASTTAFLLSLTIKMSTQYGTVEVDEITSRGREE